MAENQLRLNIRLAPATYERLWSLAGLTHHKGLSAMAKRLVEIALVEEEVEVPIPPQPDIRRGPKEQVSLELSGKPAEAIQEGASSHDISPQRFAIYAVEHTLARAAEEIPAVDELVAFRTSFIANLSRNTAKYLPLAE